MFESNTIQKKKAIKRELNISEKCLLVKFINNIFGLLNRKILIAA